MGESAWGHAIVTVARDGNPLSFYFPDPRLGAPGAAGRADQAVAEGSGGPVRGVRIARQLCVIADLDQPPADSGDAYLRLHLLSHRLVRPNSVNLAGIFSILPNVCWTSLGPAAVSEIGAVRERRGCVHHGHLVRRRHPGHLRGAAVPAGRELGPGDLPRR